MVRYNVNIKKTKTYLRVYDKFHLRINMIITTCLCVFVLYLLILYLRTIHKSYNYFKERNIPGPPHQFFFGHLKTLWSTTRYSKQLKEWTHKYGSIYGLYEGTRPLYIVSDVDFLQEVFIKQFSSFHSRRVPFLARMGVGTPENLFGASGSTWRRQRLIINPTFSLNKMKLMIPIVNECIEIMMNKLSVLNQNNEQFNIYDMFKRMTMDIICILKKNPNFT